MVFKQGDVASCVTAQVAGQSLTTQTDVKVRWPDNSIKHALVSFVIPSVPAGGSVTVNFLNGGTNANSSYTTKAQLLATDFDARMAITPSGGSTTTITARNLLNGIANPEYWVQGQVCSEFLIRDFTQNISNQLNVQYYVRYYPGWSGFRVDAVVENCWTEYRGNLTYDFNLLLGNSNPQSVFSKTGFTHNVNARWHKVFWQGNTPPAVEVRYNLPYLISTKTAPALRHLAGRPGEHHQFGLLRLAELRPRHHAERHHRDLLPDHGRSPGSRPVSHLGGPLPAEHGQPHEGDHAELRRPVRLDPDPPSRRQPRQVREEPRDDDRRSADRLGRLVGLHLAEPGRQVARAGRPDNDRVDRQLRHQAAFACIPYLVTGDFYYLEEMYFWGGWDLSDGNYAYRSDAQGLLNDQTRGDAWAIRNISDAAALAPDAHTLEKSYFTNKTNNNINNWVNRYITTGNYPAIHYWQDQSNIGADGGRPDGELVTTCRYYTSTWMDDFVLTVLTHMKDGGWNTSGLVDWLGVSSSTASTIRTTTGTAAHRTTSPPPTTTATTTASAMPPGPTSITPTSPSPARRTSPTPTMPTTIPTSPAAR